MTSLDVTPGIRIEDVVVGERYRKDLGDLAPLKGSITAYGVLQPIGVLPDNTLVFGARRLEACRQLGIPKIPYRIIRGLEDELDLLKAERDENTCRKQMTPTELMVLGKEIEGREAARKKKQQDAGRQLGGQIRQGSASAPDGAKAETGQDDRRDRRTAAAVADALGVSESQYNRMARVHNAATSDTESPAVKERAQQAMQDLDEGVISADRADHQVKAARLAERLEAEEAARPNLHVVPDDSARDSGRKSINRSADKQRGVLDRVCAALEGHADALRVIDRLQPGITAAEAARWKASLDESTRTIRRVVRTALQERIESEPA